ncbi:MAG: hypothetical protein ACXVK4_15655, partial [Acidimicrobiia bacterium]
GVTTTLPSVPTLPGLADLLVGFDALDLGGSAREPHAGQGLFRARGRGRHVRGVGRVGSQPYQQRSSAVSTTARRSTRSGISPSIAGRIAGARRVDDSPMAPSSSEPP